MRVFITTSVLLFTTLALSACAKIGLGGHSNDYVKQSREVSLLVVPKAVSSIKKDTYYVVPSVHSAHNVHAVSTLPPTLAQ